MRGCGIGTGNICEVWYYGIHGWEWIGKTCELGDWKTEQMPLTTHLPGKIRHL